jgi:opacity protein-like surface antigen
MVRLKPLTALLILGCITLASANAVLANEELVAAKTTTLIMIDGQETGSEWNGAAIVNLVNPTAVVKVKTFHDPGTHEETIFLIIQVTDSSNNLTDDKVIIFLDLLHNRGLNTDAMKTADDVGFEIARNGQLRKLTGSALAPTVVTGWVPVAQQIVVSPLGGASWTAELKISASVPDLGVAFLPAIMGLTIHVVDTPTGGGFPAESFWPAASNSFNPDDWADVKTRYPVEFVMVLDQSGSMLSANRWPSAKQAANILANTLVAFRDPAFADKMGLVTFASNCSNDADLTQNANALLPVPGAFVGSYVTAVDPLPNNCTPIGNGLNRAFGNNYLKVVSEPNRQAERQVLLLSDGWHNSPPAHLPKLLPQHLDYKPCNPLGSWTTCPPGTNHLAQVHTVAVGSDSSVDTMLLDDIKNRFSGQRFPSIYNISGDAEALKLFFVDALQDVFQINRIGGDMLATPGDFTLNTKERKLVILLSWANPAQAQLITLQRQPLGGGAFSNVTCSNPATDTTVGFSICTVNEPQEGVYRATVAGAAPSKQFNLVDLNLAATFAIDREQHGTGQDIILTARLNEAGAPVTHDPATHPVKVTVSIKRPAEAFGTYVSTHDGQSCTPRPPVLPRSGRKGGVTDVVNFAVTTASSASAAASGSDPKPARFAKIDALFKLCNKTDLNTAEDPGLELFDDGTHGDVKANDGIYTLRFVNTMLEGSYVFRFHASGKAPSGSQFGRVKVSAEYVRIKVDPAQTTFNVRNLAQSGTIVTREYYVIPRDRFKGYLGPGYPEQIKFNTTAGNFISQVLDYNNGIYSQLLRFDRSTENPVVTVTVQGTPIKGKPGSDVGRLEINLFFGRFVLDKDLNLKDGAVYGARFGYKFTAHLAIEAEGAVTPTEIEMGPDAGRDGKLIQALVNLRYDIGTAGGVTPFLRVGLGGIFLRGFGRDDNAFASHYGGGVTFELTPTVGLRVDTRVFRFNRFGSTPATTNAQVTGGVVIRF